MKDELENKLYNIDPIFFEEAIACKNDKMNEMNTCMYFGCECGDGWFKPLEKFIQKVNLINHIAKNYNIKFVCSQLKEKFGELRVYYKTVLIDNEKGIENKEVKKYLSELFDDALRTAEDECWNVCEWCGAEGGYNGENLITTSGWISRICKKCAKIAEENNTKRMDNFNNKEYIPRITMFKGVYSFLNLFHIRSFTFKDDKSYYYSIAEAFFSEKDPNNKDIYQKIGHLKQNGELSNLVKDIAIKFGIKYEDNEKDYQLLKDIVRAKFSYKYNEDLKKELIETNGKQLINMGKHCDNILGYCICDSCKDKEHKDLYAKILMEVRDELKK